MLEVEPTGQRGHAATGRGRNGNEAVARWLHHRTGIGAWETYRFAA